VRDFPSRARRSGLLLASGLAAVCCLPAAAAAAPQAPEGRGYELVTPVDKNGVSVQHILRLAGDGGGVAWTGLGAFGDAGSANAQVAYATRRVGSGWETKAFVPRYDGDARPSYSAGQERAPSFPADLSSMTFVSQLALAPADADNYPGLSFGPTDVYRVGAGTPAATLLSGGDGVVANGMTAADVSGVSDDGGSVFFTSMEAMTTDVPPADMTTKLYRWRDGRVEAVGRGPDGLLLAGGSYLGNNTTNSSSGSYGQNPDSFAATADGSSFVFGGTAGGARQVYLHVDGQPVRQISLSQRTGSEGTPSATSAMFIAATPDLQKIVIQSRDALTDDAVTGGADYLYDVATGELTYIAPDDSQTANSSVRFGIGVVNISDDGSTIYFVSTAALAPGATAGVRNLYQWTNGVYTYIAPTAAAPDRDLVVIPRRAASQSYTAFTRSGVSADGRKFLFETAQPGVVPGTDTNGRSMVYLYDTTGDAPVLSCLSCRADGSPSQGDAKLTLRDANEKIPTPRGITEDGSIIAFTSADGLVAADTNNVDDVYEYRGGRLMLVSGGVSAIGTQFAGMSADGADLYIRTNQSLVGRDVDQGLRDIYDVRLGGGEADAPPVSAPCREDECQDPPGSRVELDVPGTTLVDGSDEEEEATREPAEPLARVATLSAAQKRTLARKGRVTVSVRTTTGGRVAVALRAKIGRRTLRVGSASRTASKAATVKVPVALSAAARRALKRSGRLKLTMTVSLTGADNPVTRTFTVRAAKRGGKR
jgi:hypothetical protein